jgi:pseudaminic acid synthase
MKNIRSREKGVFVIAEVSANHGQNFDRAVNMIKEAKRCGAEAVKFQAYTPDSLTIDCDKRYFKIKHSQWGGQTLYELYKKAYTPWEWFPKLKKVADNEGIIFFATAFDKSAVDMLEELNVTIHKVASFELVDLPLIEYMAKTKKPLIISTGMATIPEIKDAVSTAKKAGAKDIILLKCVSNYPAKSEEMNLQTIPDMQKKFKCTIGLSDHSLGTAVSITAVALGAKVIEKHFTLSKKLLTPDNFFSIEAQELEELVKNARIAEKALGRIHYGLTKQEKKSKVFRRSLFVVEDIEKGEVFCERNIRSIRPGYGLHTKFLDQIIGRKSKTFIKKGTPVAWDLVSR